MNKKTKNIILIVLVLSIWTVIGWQIYSSLYSEGSEVFIRNTTERIESKKTEEKIEYTLVMDYPDPFDYEKKNLVPKNTQTRIVRPKKTVSAAPKKSISWGKIIYYGMFSNNSNSKKVGSGNINGTTVTFNEGDTILGIEVMKIYADSVQLQKEGELKYFYK